MAKVTIDNLDKAINDILEDFSKDMERSLDDVTVEVAKKGVQALRSQSRIFGGTGKYAKGWAYEKEKERYGVTVKLWNKGVPGLPHLLEFGHAKRGGGRVSGKVHIQPVEEQLVNSFIQGVETRIT